MERLSRHANGSQFLDWFQTIFIKYTENLSSKRRVLISDSHTSHLSLALTEEDKTNNVILLGLPAYLTHLLQPLIVLCFGQ